MGRGDKLNQICHEFERFDSWVMIAFAEFGFVCLLHTHRALTTGIFRSEELLPAYYSTTDSRIRFFFYSSQGKYLTILSVVKILSVVQDMGDFLRD
jgi:hypothetical protein